MDINQVRFGSYSIGNPQTGTRKSEEKQQENLSLDVNNAPSRAANADEVMGALELQGMQNLAQITVAKKEVNPTDYLSQDRINDIEAMMGEFDNGVNQVANAIEQEFPGFFADDMKNALAAGIFAQE